MSNHTDEPLLVFLTLAVSSIVYLRGFLSETYFDNDRVVCEAGILKVKVLKRGVSQRADLILDWLEAASASILSGSLSGLCLFVGEPSSHNTNEAYLFELGNVSSIHHENTNTQLYSLLRRLFVFVQGMPRAKNTCAMSMQFAGSTETDPGRLFEPATICNKLLVDGQFELQNCGSLNTALHRVSITVFKANTNPPALAQANYLDPFSVMDEQPSDISRQLELAAVNASGDTQPEAPPHTVSDPLESQDSSLMHSAVSCFSSPSSAPPK
ncbi:hypothetical protein OGAPHI_007196 [Ogataea philodendri]|uniref:HORMA domain-containing protein n=1 Tax=Ogataea philodendri TaxID=1378263 RepID=A0A9P8SZX5_9ASCO|nr:uncharacterized protein OGAPHI_007196 [Ogataea philodendri]KAH3659991.1 hypothetical protein OGAPHI_007196 [Ogataea philodendri]